jgi:hypothetical protein
MIVSLDKGVPVFPRALMFVLVDVMNSFSFPRKLEVVRVV